MLNPTPAAATMVMLTVVASAMLKPLDDGKCDIRVIAP
jgi:hypothetical protein